MNDIEQGANKRYNYYFASRWEKLLFDSKLIDGAVLNDFGHVSISTISPCVCGDATASGWTESTCL